MEKEFNVVKLIRSLRNLKAFVSSSLMNKLDKVNVDNGDKNAIDIDAFIKNKDETLSSSSNFEESEEDPNLTANRTKNQHP